MVHFVYVAKRPGVDEFLTEMAKYYEIVVYTASLNKYADPLLDLLDPNRVIRTRLFRESCVFYEGNYVKDLSLLDRDLSQSIIIDNSPSSYLFHPENAIDCSSFIDDIHDRELEQVCCWRERERTELSYTIIARFMFLIIYSPCCLCGTPDCQFLSGSQGCQGRS